MQAHWGKEQRKRLNERFHTHQHLKRGQKNVFSKRKTHQRGRRRVKRRELHKEKGKHCNMNNSVWCCRWSRYEKGQDFGVGDCIAIENLPWCFCSFSEVARAAVSSGLRNERMLRKWRQGLQTTLSKHCFFFPPSIGGIVVKNSPANAWTVGDVGSVPGLGSSPGEGNGNPLQFSCLGIPVDRGAWWATAYGVARARQDLVTKPLPPYSSPWWLHQFTFPSAE